MAEVLQSSVGQMGRNAVSDVLKVQRRLIVLGYKIGAADGVCGRRTSAGILAFQGTFLKYPDGRVDPGGKTWNRMVALADAKRTMPGTVAISPGSSVEVDYTKLVTKPMATSINAGLGSAGNDILIKKFGKPRETFSQNDQPITSKSLLKLMKTDSVGPFRVYGMAKAIDSLKLVFDDIKKNVPNLYTKIGNSGMTVCRYQRGSSSKISNHSWGTAIDLNISGILDTRGDNRTQNGLLMMAPFFNKHQWYWGASFPTEDSMHFECSQALLASF